MNSIPQTPYIPLPLVGQQTDTFVVSVRGVEKSVRFLESLGFVPGSKVRILSELGENIIVKVKGSRIAISKTIAMKILVVERLVSDSTLSEVQ